MVKNNDKCNTPTKEIMTNKLQTQYEFMCDGFYWYEI